MRLHPGAVSLLALMTWIFVIPHVDALGVFVLTILTIGALGVSGGAQFHKTSTRDALLYIGIAIALVLGIVGYAIL
jgi:hypothetical protein